jgi:outer membrane lipoprotein carrier protein
MMKKLFSFLFVVIFLSGYHGTAFSGPSEDILKKVQDVYEDTEYYQADFHQTVFLKSLGDEQISNGRVYIKKPGLMRWEYFGPEKQLIVSDGKFLWIYSPGNNQVIKSDLVNYFNSKTPYLFLLGMGKITDEFVKKSIEAKKTGAGKERFFITLIPKVEQPGLKELLLKIDSKSFQVEDTSIYDDFGNVTSFRFENIQRNSTIPDSLFQFKVPQGAEVVEPPKM